MYGQKSHKEWAINDKKISTPQHTIAMVTHTNTNDGWQDDD